jgi:hypothetical protein
MKNNNNNLTVPVKRDRHDDGAKIAMMANEIAATRAMSEKLNMYQDKHEKTLYDTIINLMDAPNKTGYDTFTVDGKLYNFTASGYEDVLEKFDAIRHELEEAQEAFDKLPGMESDYAGLISEVLGINTEDATNDVEDDDMKEKYIVVENYKECYENTAKEIQKVASSRNVHLFDININNNGLNSRIGVVTTSANKALKIVLDYLGAGMPSFDEFYKSGVTYDLGYSRRWCVDDISIISEEGTISHLTETVLIDQDCEPTKLSASESGHLTPLLDEKHCCNNCNDKGNKEVCQGSSDYEEVAKKMLEKLKANRKKKKNEMFRYKPDTIEYTKPLEPNNNCDNDKAEKSNVKQWLLSAKSEISYIDKTYYVKIRDIKHDTKIGVIICEKCILDALEHAIRDAQIKNYDINIDNITNITRTSYLDWLFELNHGEVLITIGELGMVAGDSIVISDMI